MTQQTAAKHVQTAEDSLRGFFPADETGGLSAWNTDELFQEVLNRSADDLGAIERMRHMMLRATLAAIDRTSVPEGEV
jgi:hypothetical protein